MFGDILTDIINGIDQFKQNNDNGNPEECLGLSSKLFNEK